MNNVKMLRLSKGLTQKELAEKIGTSRTTIVNIEQHMYQRLSKDVEKKLCELFETTPFRLYGTDNFRILPETKEDVEWLIEELSKELEQWEQEKNF
jgi:DNA-binding XRE family transcriptional regulator